MAGYSQTHPSPVWKITTDKTEAKVGDVVEITYSATIPANWFMYGSSFTIEGPMKTEVVFENSKGFSIINTQLTEVNAKKKEDEVWGGEITYFVEKATFTQKVKVVANDGILKGEIAGQICSDKEGLCIPFFNDVLLTVKIVK